jgi:nicotinamidase-related amidase
MHEKTALLIIDMQNDFTWPSAPMETPGAVDIVPTIVAVREAYTSLGCPVIHTRYIADQELHRLEPEVPWVSLIKSPIFACVPGHRRGYEGKGEFAVEAIIDELAPAKGELVVDKIFYSAFSKTNLHTHLQSLGIQSLVIVGIQTEVCIDDTARYAIHLGYDVTLISDATAAGVSENQAWVLRNFDANYGRVIDSKQLLAELKR